ncbi:unnamed protein product [Miscanthus lutarioriparius]|uniref:Uncharacterized protein n=1 Tax=Miscanthus lutarioriparius TaxID=422564 RepID=A0A811MX76_9POAL|nr:unnamed protein product [Miscanthus lutarioriparius]
MAHILAGAGEAVAAETAPHVVPSSLPMRAGGRGHGYAARFSAAGLWIAGFKFRARRNKPVPEAVRPWGCTAELSSGVATMAFCACGGRCEAAVLLRCGWQERLAAPADLGEEEGGEDLNEVVFVVGSAGVALAASPVLDLMDRDFARGQPSAGPRPRSAMATKRKSPVDHGGNSFSVRLGQYNNFFRFEDFEDDKSVVLMEAHLEMMQKFINFCKEKESFKRNAFKEKLTTYFREHLPSDVVDELCNLVQDNSYGKCHYCCLPAESLVLSVLQILHDASQNLGKKTHTSQVAHSSHACRNAPVCNNHDANFNSMNKKAPPASDIVHEKPPSTNGENEKYAASDKGLHSADNIYNGIEATKSFQNQVKANHVPILDIPAFLFGREFSRNTSVSSQHGFLDVYIFKETKSKGRSLDMGELADQLYNKKNLNIQMTNNMTHVVEDHSLKHQKSSRRFNVSETEMRYYKVFCGLAHSQWSCFEGVKLFKTSVTYPSLGESIELLGQCLFVVWAFSFSIFGPTTAKHRSC